ncbi:MAG TPA: choice-of-anchor Q domain-containing protein [Candidatus Binatia bacterium]|nr:choice-of-anchor Q domain-containing protein [Candidatus Binatia bacterium]
MPSSRLASLAGSLAVAVLVLAGVRPSGAASKLFIVNTVVDAVDATPGDGTCATAGTFCSLRAAVQEAGFVKQADDVAILLPAGVYRLTLANAPGPCPSGKTGALQLNNGKAHTVLISGADPSTTIIDGNQLDGVLSISTITGSTTSIDNVTIRGGNRLAANNCRRFGGGVYTFASPGSPGTVALTNCVIRDNLAQAGGGIFNEGASVTVDKSIVRINKTSHKFPQVSAGAGIENFSGSLTVDSSTISGNLAQLATTGLATDAVGGGVGIFDGPVTIRNSTISGNSADGNGGGIDVSGVIGSTVTLLNVTVAGNTADANNDGTGDGGGIANATAKLTLQNSLVATNADPGGQGVDCTVPTGPGTFAIRYAIVPALQTCSAHLSPAAVGLLSASPSPLSPLQANGGPTQTHDLLVGSAARDAGDPAGCGLTTDQRGVPRPQGFRCDLGAVEGGAPDGDVDRVPDVIDVCPTVVNTDQRDADVDKIGDVCDNCPAVANPTQATTACLTGSSKGGTIDNTGGTLSAGNVTITVPPGAVGGQESCVSATCPTSFAITGLASSEYKLGSSSAGTGLFLSAKLTPEGVTFNTPVTVVFSWPDADANPGTIDGTSILESQLRIFQNNVPITPTCGTAPCGTPPCCNTTANTFTITVTSFSDFDLVDDSACTPQPLADAVLTLARLKAPPTDDRLRLNATLTLDAGKSPADVATGTGLGIALGDAAHGLVAGARLAPGTFDPKQKRGWRKRKGGALWRYIDRSATPPGGIRRVVLKAAGVDGSGKPLVALVVRGRDLSYVTDPTPEATVTLAPHAGPCFAARFPGAPGPRCVPNTAGTALRCK